MNLASVRDVESKVAKDKDLQHLDPRRFRANIFGKFCRGLICMDESCLTHPAPRIEHCS